MRVPVTSWRPRRRRPRPRSEVARAWWPSCARSALGARDRRPRARDVRRRSRDIGLRRRADRSRRWVAAVAGSVREALSPSKGRASSPSIPRREPPARRASQRSHRPPTTAISRTRSSSRSVASERLRCSAGAARHGSSRTARGCCSQVVQQAVSCASARLDSSDGGPARRCCSRRGRGACSAHDPAYGDTRCARAHDRSRRSTASSRSCSSRGRRSCSATPRASA